jgi:hypothetical protein
MNTISMRRSGMALPAGSAGRAAAAEDAGDGLPAASRGGAGAAVRNDAAAARVVPGPRAGAPRLLGLGLIIAGCCVVLWIGVLAAELPLLAEPTAWNDAWIGLDALEAAGLLCTGLLLRRQDPRMCLAAAATAMLLYTDAWFDVMTAMPGERLLSVVMALVAELPTGSLCAVLALRHAPRR